MKLAPIYQKEWLKLRWHALALSSFVLICGGYFVFELSNEFANIEPESMMWYRFVHLGDKPYHWLAFVFIANGGLVALGQFVPEVLRKTVRILTHLPVPINQIIRQHLMAGMALVLLLNGLLAAVVLMMFYLYYPVDILVAALKDLTFAQIPAVLCYVGVSSVVIERQRRYQALKFLITLVAVFTLSKQEYSYLDLWGLLLTVWVIFAVKDSFLSIKTRRLSSPIYTWFLVPIVAALCASAAWQLNHSYHREHNKYYVFYSDILGEFVFQENGLNHTFHYGSATKALSKEEFEQALPFVFWKNLDIQGKLPVTVGDVTFDKRTIRESRMSLQYTPHKMHRNEVPLYPLFNPVSSKGSIPFPDMVLSLRSNKMEIYASETAKPDEALTFVVNQLLDYYAVTFPIKHIWGKTTNMKPFDWGYFIQDANGKLFNLGRADHQIYLKPIALPEFVGALDYIQVAENRHKKFYGYAINQNSQVYLISYPNYEFIPLELDGFDHKTMTFQLLADPIHYLVRFNDGKRYSAVRFNKDYHKQESVVFE